MKILNTKERSRIGKTKWKKDISIPVFEGEDYSMWKKRITMFFKFKKCHEVTTRERISANRPEWDEQDLTLSGAVGRLCTTFIVLVFFIFPIDFGTLSMQIYTY